MKILHTADWHLGKRLESFSRFQEQIEVLTEICEITERENIDAVIISGDLFDTFSPPTESIELFYKTLKRLANDGKRAVIAIAGNHDSPERIEAPDPLARECGIIFAGFPNTKVVPFKLEGGINVSKSDEGFIEIYLPNISFPLRVLLTPYANEYRLKTFLGIEDPEAELRNVLSARWQEIATKYCDEKGVNILAAHLYMMKKDGVAPEEPEEEKPISIGGAQVIYTENIPKQVQYVALGHLHRKQLIDNIPCPIFYSSSPLAYSFSEANQEKYVIKIDMEPGKPAKYQELLLSKGRKLLRNEFNNIDTAVTWLLENQEALIELTIVSDTFLTADERKRLYNAHSGIINIIPVVTNASSSDDNITNIDITKGIDELFVDYFKYRNGGQTPNDRITKLFKEVLATEEEI
ncbi:MAG: exonuclease sbcCD subunit D [Bacteroidetes bacterium RIFCSPLOWO2_12_FULL_35_15]|nr:MAG: exonuclease sbcCD subunit D [Bacteroidetes bacterium RIFCSPLOWO2_12_FULL_35_15]